MRVTPISVDLRGSRVRGNGEAVERLMSKVVVTESGCWERRVGLDQNGYGRFRMHGRLLYAHRVAWTLRHSEPPPGVFVCHACDNPPCVNPRHLFLGTHDDNMADMVRKGRQRTVVRWGWDHPQAKLTDADVEQIRALHARGLPHQRIANGFGVSSSHVGRLVRNEIRRSAP